MLHALLDIEYQSLAMYGGSQNRYFPDTWGSGGRATAVIAGFGIDTTLYTAVDKRTAGLLATLAYSFHFQTIDVS